MADPAVVLAREFTALAKDWYADLLVARARIGELEAENARTESVWQPVSSAPRDGKLLDLWIANNTLPYRIINCRWMVPDHSCGEAGRYCDCCPPSGEHWCDEWGKWIEFGADEEPTHWINSPADPLSSEREG